MPPRTAWNRAGAAVAFLATYFGAGLLGLQLATVHSSVSPVWPPTGIAIAGLLLLGLRFWPTVYVGAFLFNLLTSHHVPSSVIIGGGNTLEALVAAWLIQRYCNGPGFLDQVPASMRFVGAGFLAPVISASIGVATLVGFGEAPRHLSGSIWLTWWLGDAAGALVVTPAIIAWTKGKTKVKRIGEASLLAGAAVAAGYLGLMLETQQATATAAGALALLLVVMWAALRFGPRSLLTALLAWSGMAIWATTHGRGPFVRPTENEGLLLLQIFVSGLATSLLVMASASRERRNGQKESSPRVLAVSLGILPLLLALPLIGALAELQLEAQNDHIDDDRAALKAAWENTLARHESHLLDARALFDSSTSVERDEFTAYVESSQWLRGNDIQAVTFNRALQQAEIPAFEQRIRDDLLLPLAVRDNFTVRPALGADLHVVIDYVAPLANNSQVIGIDLAANQTRMNAIHVAIDSGRPIATGRILLIQEDAPGFVVYLPIYDGGDPGTVEGRRASLLGFAVAAYRIEALAQGTISTLGGHITGLTIHDAGPIDSSSTAATLVLGTGEQINDPVELDVFGRRWLLTPETDAATAPTAVGAAPWFVLLSGGALSTTFTLAAYAFESTTRRAQGLAQGMTHLLSTEKRKLEEAQSIAHVGSWEWDMRTSQLTWSPELYRLYGHEPGKHSPTFQSYLAQIHPDDRPQLEATLERASKSGDPFEIEHRFVRPDGEIRWMRSKGHLDMEAGQAIRMSGTGQDITESHLAEERFRGLVEAAPDAMIIVDETGRITLANLEAERLFGYSRAELIGRPVEDLVPQSARARHVDVRKAYTAHPEKRPMGRGIELAAVRKDGSQVPVEISLSPLKSLEGPRVAATIRDVSDRRRIDRERQEAETRLQQLTHLQELNRFKTQFINTAAHELRTPLMPMRTEIYLLLNAKQDPLSPDKRKKLEIVERNLDRLSVLVEDLLTVARQQAGRLAITPEPMDLAKVLREATETFRAMAKDRQIQLDDKTGQPLVIHADAKRISQVIMNLLSNAFKFTPPGGQISVRLLDQSNSVRVEIQDTGIGIPIERQTELFSPFAQVHDTLQVTQPGSGLGLYISREFIQMHDGRIGLASAGRGKGATFWFELPKSGPQTAVNSIPPSKANP